jgi:hypothetical protein
VCHLHCCCILQIHYIHHHHDPPLPSSSSSISAIIPCHSPSPLIWACYKQIPAKSNLLGSSDTDLDLDSGEAADEDSLSDADSSSSSSVSSSKDNDENTHTGTVCSTPHICAPDVLMAGDMVWSAQNCMGDTKFLLGQFLSHFEATCQPEGNIYFAGEYLSCHHTWITGALESAWETVSNIIGLVPKLGPSVPCERNTPI